MIQGAFQSFRHEHHFKTTVAGTVMTDHFDYTSPLDLLGRLADVLFLQRYMTRLLTQRNQVIKEVAEEGRENTKKWGWFEIQNCRSLQKY
ncbi:SRPBCC family protein [Reichenbachiella ulvae]|uniref:Uncharacterized protein n=1 Tax=Reichenbachiella ulvae TaxID=2980104 RepID=A0ABT3CQQ4_9BACT|nr:hypothetical protein [Reichenbachiella ulvae]MCV9385992.1 hypothetical protein [Reichenbachiella ulvae]